MTTGLRAVQTNKRTHPRSIRVRASSGGVYILRGRGRQREQWRVCDERDGVYIALGSDERGLAFSIDYTERSGHLVVVSAQRNGGPMAWPVTIRQTAEETIVSVRCPADVEVRWKLSGAVGNEEEPMAPEPTRH